MSLPPAYANITEIFVCIGSTGVLTLGHEHEGALIATCTAQPMQPEQFARGQVRVPDAHEERVMEAAKSVLTAAVALVQSQTVLRMIEARRVQLHRVHTHLMQRTLATAFDGACVRQTATCLQKIAANDAAQAQALEAAARLNAVTPSATANMQQKLREALRGARLRGVDVD